MLVTIIIIILFLYFLSVLLNNGDNKKTISTPSPTPSYARLEQFLSIGDYKSANTETFRLMEYSIGRNPDGYSGPLDREISCNCLCEVDRLWLTYSQGKFGFSIQAVIYYTECDGETESRGDVFQSRVGWYCEARQRSLKYNELYFDISAPKGHLPAPNIDYDPKRGWSGLAWYKILCKPFRKNVLNCNNLMAEYWRNWGSEDKKLEFFRNI